jgi:hypothetical protein
MERFLRLDVVMPVNEHGGFSRGLGSVGQDGGVSAGFTHLGSEPAVAKEGLEPPRAGLHLGRMVSFGRDGGEAEELEEQVEIGLTGKGDGILVGGHKSKYGGGGDLTPQLVVYGVAKGLCGA